MEEKKAVDRPRMLTMDWLVDKESGITYREVNEKAGRRQEWRRWNLRSTEGQYTKESFL